MLILWQQTWSESKIIYENAQVYLKKKLFLPASYSLQTGLSFSAAAL